MANARAPKSPPADKAVEALTYPEAKRKNIPTAEYQAMLAKADEQIRVAYERRNRDLDPQLVWRGKESQDASDLVVNAPPLYIQEKVHPKALIDDLLRQTREARHGRGRSLATCLGTSTASPGTPTRPSSISTIRTGGIA